jgi:hypothetical protein
MEESLFCFVAHMASMEEEKNAYRILVEKPEGKN